MILNLFFFFTFPKKWVGRAMGNETFYGDGLKRARDPIWSDCCETFHKFSRDATYFNLSFVCFIVFFFANYLDFNFFHVISNM